jgi:transposase
MDAGLAERVAKLEGERDRYRKLYLETLERCRMLELGLHGQKTERLTHDESQLSLLVLAALLAAQAETQDGSTDTPHAEAPEPEPEPAPEPDPPEEKPKRRKRAGRQVLPEQLPRVEIEILPENVQRMGLDAFERIGEEVTEVLERRQASMVILRICRPKFVLVDRERNAETKVLTAAPIDLPIERGMAGPGLLADTIVRRWDDSLPANRLEKIYAREGVHLARSTICGWHDQLATLVHPLVDAMWADAMASPFLCTDATGVLVQAKQRCERGHFWVVIAPGQHVLFAYSANHTKEAVDEMLGDYEGFLVADAHGVYDHLYATGKVIEVACWAHCRRYFFKAKSSEPDRAQQALALIGELFRIEREDLVDKTPNERKEIRQAKSKPVIDAFFRWRDEQSSYALDDTPLAKALGYAFNQRDALERFLDDGRLPLHNNWSELELRREAIGRKNWLFLGNDDGGKVNATFMTLIASCHMHGLEPWAYLRDLLCVLPNWPHSRVLELAPAHWRETSQKQEAQVRLSGDVCRQATLEDLVVHRLSA